MLFRAVLDLLKFLVFAEFSKASFDHVEEFVDVLQKSREFFTDLSCVQILIWIEDWFTPNKILREKWQRTTLEPAVDPHIP